MSEEIKKMRKTRQESIIPDDLIRIHLRTNTPGSREIVDELESMGYHVVKASCRPHNHFKKLQT